MPSIVNFLQLTFTAEQVRNINELLFDKFLSSPQIQSICTIMPGIVFDTEVGYVGQIGLVGKAAVGCNPEGQALEIPVRKVVWSPKRWEVDLRECANDLKTTMAIYSMKMGVAQDDLTDTDYIAIVVDVLGRALADMIFRFVWFGDTAGGLLTAGVDAGFFTLIDGFWKQVFAQAVTNPTQYVTIPANAEATTALQRSKLDDMTDVEVKKLFAKVKTSAPMALRGQGTPRFLVTQSIYDRFTQALENTLVAPAYTDLIEGFSMLKYNGIEIVAVPMWDQMIEAYYNNGTKLDDPHRILYIDQTNLMVGVPSTEVLLNVEVFYEKLSKVNVLRATDSIDAKIVDPTLFVAAY